MSHNRGLHRSRARAASAARAQSIDLEAVKLPLAERGFVLPPRRWMVERSFAWATRFRSLAKDYERSASTLADLHVIAFTYAMFTTDHSRMRAC